MDIIQNIMESFDYDYEFIFHEKQIISATDGAKYFGIEPGQTAPTLILKTDKGYFSLVFSGSRNRIDFNQVAKLLNVDRVKLAKRETVEKIIGFDPGNIPMVGLSLPSIFDKKLLQYPFVYGGSGQANRTLKLSPHTLEKLNNPVAFLENDS
jgi:prolyl-tRNA editing enzyme YbaK/EbsC (Cys-tRNA(Pro) deacylase)